MAAACLRNQTQQDRTTARDGAASSCGQCADAAHVKRRAHCRDRTPSRPLLPSFHAVNRSVKNERTFEGTVGSLGTRGVQRRATSTLSWPRVARRGGGRVPPVAAIRCWGGAEAGQQRLSGGGSGSERRSDACHDGCWARRRHGGCSPRAHRRKRARRRGQSGRRAVEGLRRGVSVRTGDGRLITANRDSCTVAEPALRLPEKHAMPRSDMPASPRRGRSPQWPQRASWPREGSRRPERRRECSAPHRRPPAFSSPSHVRAKIRGDLVQEPPADVE